jgi:protein HIRA/HIR1
VLGSAVVDISFNTCNKATKMLVVTSDGQFYVYDFFSLGPKLDFKGSLVAPMQHLMLSYVSATNPGLDHALRPKLARIQITDANHLMLIFSFGTSTKSLHGFVYNRNMEVWMRISDSGSFLVSNLYPTIPARVIEDNEGLVSRMDRLVRSGASMESAKQMYIKLVENEKQASQKIVTRAHCEDRLACTIALGEAAEFQVWLSLYAKCLSSAGDADTLRFLVDVLLGNAVNTEITETNLGLKPSCWWFNSITSSQCLGLNKKDLIRHNILPEMSKNRQLQRLTNEISMELE